MNKHQLEELKVIVSTLNLNNEFDNLEAEACSACCSESGDGVAPSIRPYPV